jgi:membrane protein YqaA with SNARE-associated domain
VVVLAALDSSMLVFVPFGIDTVVVYMAARAQHAFWLYPVLATAGSLAGAGVTFWIGGRVGEAGLTRLVSEPRLERLRQRVRDKGAIAMALAALIPPPFPLTAFILTCGALAVNPWLLFVGMGLARLVRFGAEGGLAHLYGRGVLRFLRSDTVRLVIAGFVVVAIIGTVVSGVVLWKHTKGEAPGAAA